MSVRGRQLGKRVFVPPTSFLSFSALMPMSGISFRPTSRVLVSPCIIRRVTLSRIASRPFNSDKVRVIPMFWFPAAHLWILSMPKQSRVFRILSNVPGAPIAYIPYLGRFPLHSHNRWSRLKSCIYPWYVMYFKTAISRGLVPYSCRIPGLVPLFVLRERNRDWSLILSYSGHLPLSGSSSVSRGMQ